MFALAIWDTRRLQLAHDRIGAKPLYSPAAARLQEMLKQLVTVL